MRFMVIMYPGEAAEAGVMPDEQILTAMGKFNEELMNAGMLLSGEGLHPTSKGARVAFTGGVPIVTDGPFVESKEIVGGFWMINAASKDEAVEWMKRCPVSGGEMIEIRQVFETEDFSAEFTPEARAAEERMRQELAGISA